MEIRRLGVEDTQTLCAVEPGLFDYAIDPEQTRAFLQSDAHEICVAIEDGKIVAFASATILLHPDKDPTMFINEVGTRESHLRRGCATAVTQALIDLARSMGCDGIWLGTEPDNAAALGLYRKMGGQEESFIGFGWDEVFDLD